jgi:hypothetical protein
MRELWKDQWTQVASAFTPEISEVFYERTQGVVDLAVKLYVLSQYRAMITGVEEITPELMNTVADDEFKLLKPMLDALASGDPVLIAKYDDLRPLEFEKLMKREQLRMSEQIDVQALRRRFEQEQASKRAQALESLRAVGMTDAMAELAVSTMFASSGGQTSAEEVSKVLDIIKPRRPASPKRGASRKSLGKDYSDEDLRNIASAGGSTSDGYGTLLAARVVVGPMAVLSA